MEFRTQTYFNPFGEKMSAAIIVIALFMIVVDSLVTKIPATILISFFILVVGYANARFGVRNKQADLIIHFHKQFDELQKKRLELLTANDERKAAGRVEWSQERRNIESEMFFDRFWSLQFDQFLAWHEGYIPSKLYVYWMFSRWRELNAPSGTWTIFGETMVTTLDKLKERWHHSLDPAVGQTTTTFINVNQFIALMLQLKSCKDPPEIDRLLCRFGPNRIRRKTRKLFGAD